MGTAKPTARGQRGRTRSIRPPRRGSPTQLPSPSDLPAARSDGTTWRRRGAAGTCGKKSFYPPFLPQIPSLSSFPPLPLFPPHLKEKVFFLLLPPRCPLAVPMAAQRGAVRPLCWQPRPAPSDARLRAALGKGRVGAAGLRARLSPSITHWYRRRE